MREPMDFITHRLFEFVDQTADLVGVVDDQSRVVYLNDSARKRLGVGAATDLTTADVFAAYERGDPVATRVVDDAIELWGMAAANLVSVLDPETVVFGGGVFGPAARFLDRIRDAARCWAQPISMRRVTFTASSLGSDAGLYGAGRLALLAGDGR